MTVERTIGRLLRSVRAGDRHLTWNLPVPRDIPATIALGSPAFLDGAPIPQRFAGAGVGDNISPPLHWSNVPAGTQQLVLILQDPDAPLPRPVTHLVATVPADRDRVDEGALSFGNDRTIGFARGSFRRMGYAGPRPPQGHGPHRYVFQIYALAAKLADLTDLGSANAGIAQSALARGRLTGTFERA